MEPILNFIDGRYVEAESGDTLASVEPATGEEYARVVSSDERDIVRAIESAEQL